MPYGPSRVLVVEKPHNHLVSNFLSMSLFNEGSGSGFCLLPHPACSCESSQDYALPLMIDNRWDKDTLFLVFEEDFRFTDTAKRSPPTAVSGAASSSAAAAPSSGEPSAPEEGPQGPRQGRWCELPTKATRAQGGQVSEELADICNYCTQAHRHRMSGSIVWLCWQPANAGVAKYKSTVLTSGAMLITISKTGATQVAQAVEDGDLGRPYHWDVMLKKWLQTHRADVAASYIWPPMGNYTTHVSGCEQQSQKSVRKSCWDMKWCCPGTKVAHDPQHRQKWLLGFTADKSPTDWRLALVEPSATNPLFWKR